MKETKKPQVTKLMLDRAQTMLMRKVEDKMVAWEKQHPKPVFDAPVNDAGLVEVLALVPSATLKTFLVERTRKEGGGSFYVSRSELLRAMPAAKNIIDVRVAKADKVKKSNEKAEQDWANAAFAERKAWTLKAHEILDAALFNGNDLFAACQSFGK